MSAVAAFGYGEAIVLRFFPNDQLRWAKPVRVVEDSSDAIVLYLAANTRIMKPLQRDGSDRSAAIGEVASMHSA